MEAELAGELREGGRPDRLPGSIPAARHRLHVVEDEHPGHPAEGDETVDEPAEEGLLAHVGGEAHPGPAAVLQAAGQEVARRGGLLGEGEVPDLPPVDLQVLRGQPLEAERHVGLLLLLLFEAHPRTYPRKTLWPPTYGRGGSARASSSIRSAVSPSRAHPSICGR